ncbi:MAG TPA: hypothetical protein PLI09_19060 [Candidatus Hydrogenedentes bacterium]|nr:hypothetical protein [Candidatus Hydrogenedentota bacterium]
MSGMWLSGISSEAEGMESWRAARTTQLNDVLSLRTAVRDLSQDVAKLALLNQALWELLRTKLRLTDQELEQMAREIDLRDGRADGQITAQAVQCPSCNRINNSKHAKCLYCGQLFEKPIFG